MLGYKILCGHAWAYDHCPRVRHVAKSDDNVEVQYKTDTSDDGVNQNINLKINVQAGLDLCIIGSIIQV